MSTLRKALFLFGFAVASLGAFGQSASAAPMLIDDFSSTVAPFSSGSQVTNLGGGVTRTITINGSALGLSAVSVNSTVPNALDSFASSLSAFSTVLQYDFAAQNFLPTDSILLPFLASNGGTGATTLDLKVELLGGPGGSLNFAIADNASPFNLPISFGAFGPGPFNGITGIRFTFNQDLTNATDFTLGGDGGIRITGDPVPEPATLATFGLMGLVGGFVARRKLARAATAA